MTDHPEHPVALNVNVFCLLSTYSKLWNQEKQTKVYFLIFIFFFFVQL